jgi:large subunit ribosomal protein L1
MAHKGKRFRNALDGIERGETYAVEDAVKMVKERAVAKFDETIEIAVNRGVEPRHAAQNVRDAVVLPNGTG